MNVHRLVRRRGRALIAATSVVLSVTLVSQLTATAGLTGDVGDADPSRRSAPEVDAPGSIEGANFRPRSNRALDRPEPVDRGPVRWPAAGRVVAQVPDIEAGDAAFARAGDTPVAIGDPTSKAARATGADPAEKDVDAPANVAIEIAPQATSQALDLAGVVAEVATSGSREMPGPVAVKIDYSGFGHAYGGDWGSRLRIVQLPDCATTTPQKAACRIGRPLATTNNTDKQTVTAVIDLGAPDPGTDPSDTAPTESDGLGETPPAPVVPAPVESSAPTTAPTQTPSAPPTEGPVEAPTGEPTQEPSAPGSEPMVHPTAEPEDQIEDGAAGRAHQVSLAAVRASRSGEGGGATFAVVADAESATGDWGATPLSEVATWSAGGSAGSATWSYPLRVPPVPGGLTPSLSLGYDSASIDGRTSSKNNQPSWIGEGFDLVPGFIERRYVPCADDTGAGQDLTGTLHQEPNNDDDLPTGDLCWRTDNAVLSLGSASGELVAAGGNEWRKRFDDGTRIRRLTGASNGADGGEHWELTTPGGLRYYFGLGRVQGEDTHSAWTVPVYGNHPGEPGHAGTFASSVVPDTAWRWNLDYVVDTHGNALAYLWNKETNKYGRAYNSDNATPYTRGGTLSRIDYGLTDGQGGALITNATGRVEFTTAQRCDGPSGGCDAEDFDAAPERWLDIPGEQVCADVPCNNHTPTFFTRKQLTSVTTSIRSAGWKEVDRWTLQNSFLRTGGAGSGPILWLSSIQHAGLVDGSQTQPKVTFVDHFLNNRVDSPNDDASALRRPRVSEINTGTGEKLVFDYEEGTQCLPSSTPQNKYENTSLCFPVRYAPPGQPFAEAQWHWFHKYVVHSATRHDAVSGSVPVITEYDYVGQPAWAYDDSVLTSRKDRTWNQWRGYEAVRTTVGDGQDPQNAEPATKLESVTTYYRGLRGTKAGPGPDADELKADGSGDYEASPGALAANEREATITSRRVDGTDAGIASEEVPDHQRFQGMARQTITYNGNAVVSIAVTEPWHGIVTATADRDRGGVTARLRGVASTHTFTMLADDPAKPRHTEVRNTARDTKGYVTASWDLGDVAKPGDDLCTTTTYARNQDKWILDRVATVRTVSNDCDGPATPADDAVVSWTKNSYDEAVVGDDPIRGLLTKVQEIKSYADGAPVFYTAGQVHYDRYGRVTVSTDALGRATRTDYQPAEGPVTALTVTYPTPSPAAGEPARPAPVETTTLDPRLGMATSVTDPSGSTTAVEYDPLGRVSKVWLDDRDKSKSADLHYTYELPAPSGLNAVTTRARLAEDGDNDERMLTSIALYDGLLRPRQTQTQLLPDEQYPAGGRLITRTTYDTRGLAIAQEGPAFNDSAVSTALFNFTSTAPARTFNTFDGAGRPKKREFIAYDEASIDANGDPVPSAGELHRSLTSFTYTGDQVHVDAPVGGIDTTTHTDARGRTIALTQHGATDLTTSYTHTGAGQLKTMTDPATKTWRYTYDLRGNQIRAEDPDHGVSESTYDDLGQLTSTTDALGQTLVTQYDELGRKTALREDGPDGILRAQWGYDRLPGGQLRMGLPTSSTRWIEGVAITTATARFDSAGRPERTETRIPEIPGVIEAGLSGTYVTEAAYNDDGSLRTTRVHAFNGINAEELHHGYDSNGRPEYLTGAGSYIADVLRAPYGEALRYGWGNTWKNAAWLRYQYQPGTRRITDTWVDRESVPVTDDHTSYSYDLAGNPLKITTVRDANVASPLNETQCFRYDKLAQLTAAWTPAVGTCAGAPDTDVLAGPAAYARSWDYFDASGNRHKERRRGSAGALSESVYSYTATGPHQLAQVSTTGPEAGTDTYTYDAAGNTKTRTVAGVAQALAWDVEGKLHTVTGPNGVLETNYYDSEGDRLIRRDPALTTLFLGDTEVRLDRANHDQLTFSRYYTFDAKTIAVRDGNTMADVQILIPDAHNTAGYAIENSTGQLLTRPTTPFGGPRGTKSPTWASSRGFVDGAEDSATGMTTIGARTYDSTIGRFISVDPLLDPTNPQQVNGYTYALNNPMTYSDPTGLMPCANCDGSLDGGSGTGGTTAPVTVGCLLAGTCNNGPVNDEADSGSSNQETGACQDCGVVVVIDDPTSAQQITSLAWEVVKFGVPIQEAQGCLLQANGLDCLMLAASAIPGGRLSVKVGGVVTKLGGKALDLGAAAANKTGDAFKSGWRRLPWTKNCSFGAATAVLMGDGTSKPISEIQIGDMVWAKDPTTGEAGPREVTAVWVHHDTLSELVVDGGVIVTTEDHPFWNATDGEWQRADQLDRGESLGTIGGQRANVVSFEPGRGDVATAYNLTVDGLHTYFVQSAGTRALVHNSCDFDSDGIEHVIERHSKNGSLRDVNAGVFDDGTDFAQLARGSEGQVGKFNADTGNVEYVVNAGRVIGNTGAPSGGLPTTSYTVVRKTSGELVTMYPGH
ncbi:MAG: RHS repeat-associated core domain-containing protein [Sporichthyaceae bacterium]